MAAFLRNQTTGWTLVGLLWLAACAPEPTVTTTPPAIDSLGRLQPEIREDLEKATASLQGDLTDPRRWGQLGLRYEANGLPEAALQCFAEAHRLQPKEAKWPYRAGVVAKRTGDLPGSIAWLKKSLAIDDSYPTTYHRIGESQLQMGQLAEAKANFQAVLDMDPGRPEAWAALARVRLQEDDPKGALEAIERARQIDREGAFWKLVHGNVLVQLDRESEALPLLKSGQGSKPILQDPWSQTAQSPRSKQGDLLERGKALEAKGDYSGAVRAYRELIAMRPGEAHLPLMLARTLLRANRIDDSLRVVDETLESFPTHLELLVLRGALLQKSGNVDAAWECASQALQFHADRPDGHMFVANLHAAQRNLEAARMAAKRAFDLAPSDTRTRESLATILLQMKRPAEAAGLLEEPIYEVGFRAPLGYFHLLGQCLESIQATQRLQAMVRRARAIHGDHVFRRN